MASNKIGLFSYSYAFNRHRRLKAYSEMFPEMKLVLFTTNARRDIGKWIGIKNLKIVELKPTFFGYLELIKYCNRNKLRYLTHLGHRTSLPLLFLNKLVNGTKYIAHKSLHGKIPLRERLFYRFADKIQVNDYKTYLELKHSPYRKKVHYLAAPTDTSFYVPKNKKAVRKKLGLPLNKKIVLSVGRVSKTKGSDFLYNAIKTNEDFLFIIIGEIVDKKFEKLKSPNYLYLGKKDAKELVDYYNAADLGFFVILIDGGGLAMTSHECLSCGTPIIIAERKKEEKDYDFILVPEETNESINKEMRKFFASKKRDNKKISKACRDFAINRCSITKLTKPYRRAFMDEK